MKTTRKNYGMKMTEEDIETLIAQREARLARQKERREALDRAIENNENDIEQLKYTLKTIKHYRKERSARTVISHKHISAFFTHISHLFVNLEKKFNRLLNYTWFCLVINARFCFESRTKATGRNLLSPSTVLSYFKRERGISV